MANAAELAILLTAKDQASATLGGLKSKIGDLGAVLKVAGAAMTAVGGAGLVMVESARNLNAQLGQTAITLGVSQDAMRDLALATTDVSFPLDSVAKTFEMLARAGVRDTEQMRATAKAFDALADATGSSAEVLAEQLIPVYRAFGLQLPTTTTDMDKFTWLTKTTTVDLSDFALVVQRLAPEMQKAGISVDDAAIALAALTSKGITGRKATMELAEGVKIASEKGISLARAMGLTKDQVEGYRQKMVEATGGTEEYAKAAATQFGIMDNLKQMWQEMTLRIGSMLTPLEPVLGLMTALGPILLLVGTNAGIATTAINIMKLALNLLLGPVGLVMLAIGALFVAWQTNFGGIQEKTQAVIKILGDLFGWIRDRIVEIFEGLTSFFREWGGKILEILTAPFKLFYEAIRWVAGLIGIELPSWEKMWTNLGDTVGNMANEIGDKLGELGQAMDESGKQTVKALSEVTVAADGTSASIDKITKSTTDAAAALTTFDATKFKGVSIVGGQLTPTYPIANQAAWNAQVNAIAQASWAASAAAATAQRAAMIASGEILGYQYGGMVPGPIGVPRPAIVHGGETITPPGKATAINVNFYGDVYGFPDFARKVAEAVKASYRGGGLRFLA